MRNVSCLALASIVVVMSGCAVDAEDRESLSEIESASSSQCPVNAVCAWSGMNYTGTFSWWTAGDDGCKAHPDNPTIRSGVNNTGRQVRFGGGPILPPSTNFFSGYSIVGLICWYNS